jgi:dipeptidyl aminopeptidase/acylaminoacyl peptidase
MADINKQQQYPFDRFASIRRYTGFDFLKQDPSWIIYIADTNGQFNLWRQRSSLDQDGELYAPHQLTTFIDDAVRHAFPSTIDNSVIFFADHQGTENFQIYKINNAFLSWPQPITQNPKIRYEWGAECFSHDGRYITYSSNEANPLNMLVYIRNIISNETLCITDRPGWYIPGYWSPDNRRINCSQLVTLTEYSIWLLDILDRKMIQVTKPAEEEKSRNIVGPWLPNGQGFYVITDLKREYAGLAFYDINKSNLEWILTPEHDIESVDLSKDGKILAWTENVHGYSNVYIKNLKNGGEIQEISEISKNGVIGDLKISPDGKRIGVMMTTSRCPSNIYVIDIESKKAKKLTESLLGNIPEEKMIQPKLIKYKSFDRLEIHAFLYSPRNGNNNTNNKFGAIL